MRVYVVWREDHSQYIKDKCLGVALTKKGALRMIEDDRYRNQFWKLDTVPQDRWLVRWCYQDFTVSPTALIYVP